jgi:hypothetical protein
MMMGFLGLGIVLIPAYYYAYRAPQYVINKQVILGDHTWEQKFLRSHETGWLSFLAVFFLPPVYVVMIVTAYIRNYDRRSLKLSTANWSAKIKQCWSTIKNKLNSFR